MTMRFHNIGIIGGGAWGTALAQIASQSGRDVLLWALEPATVADINARRENRTYLPGVELDAGVCATADLGDMASRDAILIVTPAQHLRTAAAGLATHLRPGTPVVICAKGIEQGTGRTMTEVLSEALPHAAPAILSGPSFAREVASGLPTAVTLACAQENLGRELAHMLARPTFRLYWTDDVVGAQVGGAVKNVLAIAAGIVAGRKLGASAHAALTTRGFAEMVRFGQALGGRPETMMGLSGLGDLILTCGSPQSRNMSLGEALGEGRSLAEALGARMSVAEGVYTASAVVAIAAARGIDMPVCAAVDGIVSGRLAVDSAIEALLARPLRAEGSSDNARA